MTEPRIVIETYRAIVPVPWRLRLRYWWLRRRLTPQGRALADEIDRDVLRRMIGV